MAGMWMDSEMVERMSLPQSRYGMSSFLYYMEIINLR